MDWKKYQEKTAEYFRSLGLEANTDITIQGVRTKHDIDVLVKSHHAGFEVIWLIECKYWKSKVTKLHVLALREIVNDTGADRGILLAEHGFQSGAKEAAALTNVYVTSLDDAASKAGHEIDSMKLIEIYDRLLRCKEEYWKTSKSKRIDCGLRPNVTEIGYSGDWVIKIGEELITKGLRGDYPIKPDGMHVSISESIIEHKIPREIENIRKLLAILESLVRKLEQKISACKKV
ncbi:restriction endonuclease [Kangiella sp.]|uniref:restriction endonuclease n=1 Tax=Kangiella sp. TaxID=1920245 RepID=UPI0019C76BF7|nr:restriction endonuclease [Kangiella sp.]MBD3653869.1 restriction endonuclease [Kangiella sp.]